jgi:hypothetical protein
VGCLVEGLGGGAPQDSVPDKAVKLPLYKVHHICSCFLLWRAIWR